MPTILIKGGYLLDPDLPFERRDILVEDDLISEIAPNIDFPAGRVVDASNKVVLPGLISAHSHTYNRPVRGLTDSLPLDPWRLCMFHAYGLLDRLGQMTPRNLYLWSAIGAAEYLRTGTTSILEL